MTDAACPLPQPVDYKNAKATYSQVRKDTNYKLSPEANRREAARRLGTDYDTFSTVLASKGKGLPPASTAPVPKPKTPVLPDDPQRLAYDKGWNASKTTKTFDLDAAESRFISKYGASHQDDFLRGWSDHGADHEKYHSFTPKSVKPSVPTEVNVPTINKMLNEAGFQRQVMRKAGGYRSRVVGDRVQVSYFGDDVSTAIPKMRERLENAGYRVEPGDLRTDFWVQVRPSST